MGLLRMHVLTKQNLCTVHNIEFYRFPWTVVADVGGAT